MLKDFQFEENSSCVSDGDQWSIAVNELDFDIDELINESQQNCWNRIWKSCINYHGIEEKFSHSGTPTFNGGPWPNDPGLLISDEMLENIIGSEINVKYNGKCATCRNGRCVISMFFEQLSTDEDDDSGDNYDTSDSDSDEEPTYGNRG